MPSESTSSAFDASGAVFLTAAQLNNFISVQTGAITLTSGGSISFAGGDTVLTSSFTLNAAGNTLDLSSQTVTSYTVNGGIGGDIITGGENIFGDTLNGGGGNDTLNGGGGENFLTGGAGMDIVNGGSGRDRMIITL